jgi:hypothetical protein
VYRTSLMKWFVLLILCASLAGTHAGEFVLPIHVTSEGVMPSQAQWAEAKLGAMITLAEKNGAEEHFAAALEIQADGNGQVRCEIHDLNYWKDIRAPASVAVWIERSEAFPFETDDTYAIDLEKPGRLEIPLVNVEQVRWKFKLLSSLNADPLPDHPVEILRSTSPGVWGIEGRVLTNYKGNFEVKGWPGESFSLADGWKKRGYDYFETFSVTGEISKVAAKGSWLVYTRTPNLAGSMRKKTKNRSEPFTEYPAPLVFEVAPVGGATNEIFQVAAGVSGDRYTLYLPPQYLEDARSATMTCLPTDKNLLVLEGKRQILAFSGKKMEHDLLFITRDLSKQFESKARQGRILRVAAFAVGACLILMLMRAVFIPSD